MDAVEALRPLLPWWTGWAPLALWLPAACVIGWTTAALARRVAIGPYRRLAPGSSWVERARHAQPARAATVLSIGFVLGALGVVCALRGGAALSWLPTWLLVTLVCACAYAAGTSVMTSLVRELGLGARRMRDLVRDDLVTVLLACPHVLLALAFAPALRAPFDLRDAVCVAVLLLLYAAVALGGGLRVLGWLGLAQPAPESLRRACAEVAAERGRPEPRVTLVRWGPANAFAFPLSNEIAFSAPCLELFDEAELRGIAAHELAHVHEPLVVRLTRGAMLFAMLPLAGLFAAADLVGRFGPLGMTVLVFVLALLFRRLASRMERRADHEALGGAESAPVYARALERLYEVNLIPAVMPGSPVHPHLYDRLLAAGVTPAWPRPEPPSERRLQAAILVAAVWLTLCGTTLALAPGLLRPADGESASDWWIALEPGAQALHSRALLEHSLGHGERALAFARAAAALEPGWHEPTSLAAMELARQGRCREATQALGESLSRCTCGEDAWVETARSWVIYCETRARETTSAEARL